MNGPQHAPFAQRLALRWVIVGDICLNGAHKPSTVNVFKTHILGHGRAQPHESMPKQYACEGLFKSSL